MLGIPGVIAVFTALFSEQRIIMTADDIGLLSECMHGAGALLYPFRWQHIFVSPATLPLNLLVCRRSFSKGVLAFQVPLLPRKFLDYLTASIPFLCGIHSSLFDEFQQL